MDEIWIFVLGVLYTVLQVCSSVHVSIKSPAVVNLTQPFNVTCEVDYSDKAVSDIIVVKLQRKGSEDKTFYDISVTGALNDTLRNDICYRYDLHNTHEKSRKRLQFKFITTAAFAKDGGKYACIAFSKHEVNTNADVDNSTTTVQVVGSSKVEKDYLEVCKPTTVTETTTTIPTTIALTTTQEIPTTEGAFKHRIERNMPNYHKRNANEETTMPSGGESNTAESKGARHARIVGSGNVLSLNPLLLVSGVMLVLQIWWSM